MNKDELHALAKGIIEAGYAEGKEENDVKGDMLLAKIQYGKINGLFKSISIELGHLVDPKDVTEEINKALADEDFSGVENWAEVQAVADRFAEEITGATAARAITLIRAHCKEEEVELPKKPRSGGTGGGPRTSKVATAVVELFNTNPAPTKQDFYDAVFPVVGGDKRHSNVLYYMNIYFAVCLAVKGSTDLDTVGKYLGSLPTPEGSDEQIGEEVDAAEEAEEAEDDNDSMD